MCLISRWNRTHVNRTGCLCRYMYYLSRFDRYLFPYFQCPTFSQFFQIFGGQEDVWFQGLSSAPLTFKIVFQTVTSYLHIRSVFIHSYLDDSLLNNQSSTLSEEYTHFAIRLLLDLDFFISWKKSESISSQDFIFLEEHYHTDLGLVFPQKRRFWIVFDWWTNFVSLRSRLCKYVSFYVWLGFWFLLWNLYH